LANPKEETAMNVQALRIPGAKMAPALDAIVRLQLLARKTSGEIRAFPIPRDLPETVLFETQLRLCFDYETAFEQNLVFWERVADMLGFRNVSEDTPAELKQILAPHRESVFKVLERDDTFVPTARRFCQAIGMASES
jgi:hypothetical protein